MRKRRAARQGSAAPAGAKRQDATAVGDGSDFSEDREPNEANAPSLLQSVAWAELKSLYGWRALWFAIPPGEFADDRRDEWTTPTSDRSATTSAGPAPLLVLVRSFGRLLRMAYVPHGPGADLRLDGDGFRRLAASVVRRLPPTTLFVRWDLPHEWSTAKSRALRRAGFRPAGTDVQPPHTVIVDLEGDESEITARMKPKTRYNVRLAAKRGVSVREADDQEIGLWYAMYRETARRDRIALHREAYYRSVVAILRRNGIRVRLLFAEHEGDLLAGIVVAEYAGTATYLYGASADRKRNLMPAYLLQWEAIRLAKTDGCRWYDLFGIPPADDPAHPMHGLYRFKVGFGGRIVRRLGAWDQPRRPVVYRVYRLAESARVYYYKVIRKRRS